MCMLDDGDGWKVYRSLERKAAKEHRCDECGRTIAKGERYRYTTGVTYESDGWMTMATCLQCWTAAGWLSEVCGGWLFTVIAEDLANHVIGDESYLRSRPLTRLVRWQRDDWLTRTGELRPVDTVAAVVQEAIDAYKAQHERAVAA